HDPERLAACEHRDHDRHETLSLGHERCERAGAHDREVRTAEAGESAGAESGVTPRRDDADARCIERFRLLARRAQVETRVGPAEDPGDGPDAGKTQIYD